ncbi:MAG: hypothetical protein K9J12_00710 [Melioribacteraceae bacterium]|nr:hypothetical protein [Melioribacteraceae bacterium]MCF8265269.1 hypothetical protein [Melioribacteraceae bacterium]MCF8413270.1 hypothetical protein [Melioribacteraceae bacterium]MCF8431731.1 hypothetical protein [Melioribacteraceae bacterium]
MLNRIIIILISIILLIGAFIYLTYEEKAITYKSAELLEYNSVDKLFTSFAYVPIIDYQRGKLKRNLWMGEDAVLGYCWRQYEVGIGYDSLSLKIIENMGTACDGNYYDLPEPKILSTNPVSSEAFGKYDRLKCDEYDLDVDGERKSHEIILKQLKNDAQWNRIVENSKKTLSTFIKIYCE